MKECPECHQCFPDDLEVCPNDRRTTRLTLSIDPLILGRYRLEQSLGRGSVSVVYRGSDLASGKTVAVKVIFPELIRHDRALGVCAA